MDTITVLEKIDNDRKVDRNLDGEFLFEYQKALLLALKEMGTLDEMQYRYAEQKLKNQRNDYIKTTPICLDLGGFVFYSSRSMICRISRSVACIPSRPIRPTLSMVSSTLSITRPSPGWNTLPKRLSS